LSFALNVNEQNFFINVLSSFVNILTMLLKVRNVQRKLEKALTRDRTDHHLAACRFDAALWRFSMYMCLLATGIRRQKNNIFHPVTVYFDL